MARDIHHNARLSKYTTEYTDAGPRSLPNLHFYTDIGSPCPFAGHYYGRKQHLCKRNIDDLHGTPPHGSSHLPRDPDQPQEGSISDVHKPAHQHHHHERDVDMVCDYRPRAQSWDNHDPPRLNRRRKKGTETVDDLAVEFTKLTCDLRKLSIDLPNAIPENTNSNEIKQKCGITTDSSAEEEVFNLEM